MQRNHHHTKKHPFARFLEYGFHLWILLFVANFLIFYTFSLFGRADEPDEPATQLAQADPTISVPVSDAAKPTVRKQPPARVPTKKPNGPRISLAFSVPGIGSGGGILNPTRPTRNVTVYLYSTDVNSIDNKVKPLYSTKTTAEFDANESSPTYTAFVNSNIELGDTVKPGKYQVAFITEQSLRKLVKDKEESIGGKVVNINMTDKTILPLQRVIMGDIAPAQGNNVMDIDDYNVMVACFAQTACTKYKQADLNDDGEVDGVDFNIMALGFKTLVAQGFPPPALPTVKPTQVTKLSQLKATPKPSPSANAKPSAKPVQTKSAGNPAGAIIGFFFFLLILGGAGFFAATKTKFGKAFLATHPLPFLTPKVTKKPDQAAAAEDKTTPAEETPAENLQADETSVAESTEIPIEELEAAKNGDQPAETPAPAETPPAETPAAETPADAPAADGAIDKTYYVKNKSKDDKGTWFVLTDDAGPVDGLYSGDIEDGFERIKGTMVEENGKKYVKITEVLPSEG